ncbi:MAG: ATP-binding protein [Caulobacteraceae bacterium]|nr:MAG: ATP-binding protein [Caulobacteraceae bacterium]
MWTRPLDQITAADLHDLVLRRQAEGRRLDFKARFPESGERAVREFLADVSSFANTDGGDIVIGVADDGNGVAASVPGIDPHTLDEDLLRIEGQLRDCLDPRLPAFHVQTVPLDDGRVALVLRVSASLLAPHRVNYKSSRFFGRNSRGKFEMDTSEIRLAFAATDELPRKLRDLHVRAIAATDGVNMPCFLDAGPTVILTVAPLSILREARDIPVTRHNAVLPPDISGYRHASGLDGVVMFPSPNPDTGTGTGWAYTRRRGYVDIAWTIGRDTGEKGLFVWRNRFEAIDKLAGSSVARLREHGLEGPWVAMATLQGAKGYRIVLGDHHPTEHVWQEPAYLGEIIADALTPENLKPFHDRFWRLFGMDAAPRRER